MRVAVLLLFLAVVFVPSIDFNASAFATGGILVTEVSEEMCGKAETGDCVSNDASKVCMDTAKYVAGTKNGVRQDPLNHNNDCATISGNGEHCLNVYPRPMDDSTCDPQINP